MNAAVATPGVSFEEYLDLEEVSDVRHEWCDGAVFAMSRGTPEHGRLTYNIGIQLAVCFIVEVLSESTERYAPVAHRSERCAPQTCYAGTMVQAERTATYEEYLAFDEAAETKHEFVNGQIVAMAGGSARHSALAFRVGAAIASGLTQGCLGFQSDLRVRVLATGRATYPDASVICGPIERDPADRKGHTVTNPTLIVEVLSPSTEADDRGAKWGHYMRIPSLQEYVLVSQDQPRVERYRRNETGSWEYTDFRSGVIELVSGGMLDIGKLYEDLPEEIA